MTQRRQALLASTLLERELELRAIGSSLVAAAQGDGRLLVIEGEAGIGKSSLLAHAVDRARGSGFRVLAARGSELERDYPYGLVTGLLELMLDDVALPASDLFAGHAELARPIVDPADRNGPTPDPFAIVHGLYWLVLNAAEHGPLLLAVDDAHWADETSVRFLHYLAQRLDGAPIALVTTFRPPDAAEETQALRLLRQHPAAIRLSPGRLSETAVGELLAMEGGRSTADVVRACWEATQGNAFYVTELLREVGVAALAAATAEGRPLHALLPETVARSIQTRLEILGGEETRLAEAVAVLDTEANLHRATRLAGIAEERGGLLVRRLVDASILAPADGVAFIHPIVRAAVYGRIPRPALRDAHRRAAWVLADEGAAPEAVAVQLLSAEQTADPRAVEVLMQAAGDARAQGDPRVSATYLRRALAEPPTAEDRPKVLSALAAAEAAQRSETALDRYREALGLLTEPRRRAELLLELGHAQIAAGKWREATESFEEGMEALGGDRDDLYSRLEGGFVSAAWVSMTKRVEAERRLNAILASGTLDPAQRELVTWVAYQRTVEVGADAAEIGALVNRAIEGVPVADLVGAGQTVEVAAGVLLAVDLEADIRFLTDALAVVERSPAHPKLGVYSYCRSWPNYYTGRLGDAMADAQAAVAAAEQGWETFFPATCAVLAMAQVERGELDAAERTIDIGEEWAQRIDYGILVPIARGRIALARGDAATAAEHFAASAAVCEAMSVRGPVMSEWRPWRAVALARLGERDEARRVATEALDIAKRWGVRWTIGVALRAVGLAEGGDRGMKILENAVAVLENSPARLELARATIDFGAALRRAGNLTRARSELARGSDLAYRVGAFFLVNLARDELLAAGARPRRYAIAGPDSLTPSELRVARMAAAGGTNRELAQALFVTPKAVEYHLANVYRKLGIASRRELAEALTERPSEGAA